jgi:integrase
MGRSKVDPDRVVIGDLSAIPMRERGTTPEGRRYWRIRVKAGKSGKTLATGWWTREEAEAAVEAARRTPRPSAPSGRAAAGTVADLLDRWSKVQVLRLEAGEIAPRTLGNYQRTAGHWLSALGDVRVEHLTRELAEDTIRGWRTGETAIAPRTAALAADVLAAVVAWGHPRGLCPNVELGNLLSAQVDPEEHVNCEYTPTRTEVDAVLAEMDAGRDRVLVELLALTGARIGEAVALRVGSWDPARGELAISGRDRSRGRRGKVRTRLWPVFGRLGELLEELTADRAPDEVLVQNLPVEVPKQVAAAIGYAAETLDQPRFTAHGIRRMVTMELLETANGNAKAVSRLTGHSVAILLRDYIRPTDDHLRSIVQRSTRRKVPLRMVAARNSGTGAEEED